jgi:uncharacterized protein
MTQVASPSDLVAVLDRHKVLAIAVSGGVDSMTLAFVAHRFSRAAVTVFHAISPAVPAVATRRVQTYAERHGWQLICLDAGELADPTYRANPVNRCYYCKGRLYASIRAVTGLPIASGTNIDDLHDFRPGLEAAQEFGVVHPFVEAGFRKSDIYALAGQHRLTDLAALPAQPCLASRMETGIAIDAASLAFIEAVETKLGMLLPTTSMLRCRITAWGVAIECAPLPDDDGRRRLMERAAELCASAGRHFVGLRPYHRGSAFLRQAVA